MCKDTSKDIGMTAISELIKLGFSYKEIEKVLLQTLNETANDMKAKQLLESLSKIEGEKLFDESVE